MGRVIISSPTFGVYAIAAKLSGVDVIDVPLSTTDWSMDRDGIEQAISTYPQSVVFLCRPNAPTGNLHDEEKILSLINKFPDTTFVFDEAYIEYSASPSMIHQLQNYANMIVLRTFSKYR